MRLLVGALYFGFSQAIDVPVATPPPTESKASIDARLHLVAVCPEVTTKCGVPKTEAAEIPDLAAALDCMLKVDLNSVAAGPCHDSLELFLSQHKVNVETRMPTTQVPFPIPVPTSRLFPVQHNTPPMVWPQHGPPLPSPDDGPRRLLILFRKSDDDDQVPSHFKPPFPWTRPLEDERPPFPPLGPQLFLRLPFMDEPFRPMPRPSWRGDERRPPWMRDMEVGPSTAFWMHRSPPFMHADDKKSFWMREGRNEPWMRGAPKPFWMHGSRSMRGNEKSFWMREERLEPWMRGSFGHGQENRPHPFMHREEKPWMGSFKPSFWMHGKEDRRPTQALWMKHADDMHGPRYGEESRFWNRDNDQDRRSRRMNRDDEERRSWHRHDEKKVHGEVRRFWKRDEEDRRASWMNHDDQRKSWHKRHDEKDDQRTRWKLHGSKEHSRKKEKKTHHKFGIPGRNDEREKTSWHERDGRKHVHWKSHDKHEARENYKNRYSYKVSFKPKFQPSYRPSFFLNMSPSQYDRRPFPRHISSHGRSFSPHMPPGSPRMLPDRSMPSHFPRPPMRQRASGPSPLMLMMLPKLTSHSQSPMSTLLQMMLKSKMSSSYEANYDYDYEYDDSGYDYDFEYDYDYDYDSGDGSSALGSILQQMTAHLRPPINQPKVELAVPPHEVAELTENEQATETTQVANPAEITKQTTEIQRPIKQRAEKGVQPTEQVSYRNAP